MKYSKSHYTNMALPQFWSWGFFEKGLHHFIKYSWITLPKDGKYSEILATEEDLTNGNLEFYFKHGLSR